jgi:hypothetical protein
VGDGEMTQTFYAHMNKRNFFKSSILRYSLDGPFFVHCVLLYILSHLTEANKGSF